MDLKSVKVSDHIAKEMPSIEKISGEFGTKYIKKRGQL